MAWEWVAPAVTGLVGVAGTAGTVLVARIGRDQARNLAEQNREEKREQWVLQAEEERQKTLRQERRETYGRFIAAGSDVSAALTRRDMQPLDTVEKDTELTIAIDELLHRMGGILSEIGILGTFAVYSAGHHYYELVSDYVEATSSNVNRANDLLPELGPARVELENKMRAVVTGAQRESPKQ